MALPLLVALFAVGSFLFIVAIVCFAAATTADTPAQQNRAIRSGFWMLGLVVACGAAGSLVIKFCGDK